MAEVIYNNNNNNNDAFRRKRLSLTYGLFQGIRSEKGHSVYVGDVVKPVIWEVTRSEFNAYIAAIIFKQKNLICGLLFFITT